MKTHFWRTTMATLLVTTLAWAATTVSAQNSTASVTVQPETVGNVVPELAYGVADILHLKQAEVSDDTIIAFIKNSGNSYGLNADQIIYLRQQGLSAAVINTMLNQPKAGVAAAASTAPATLPVAATVSPEQVLTATVAPTVTYVQAVPTPTYYYSQPAYYPVYGYCYYPYPAVSLSFGWHGGGWHHGWHR